jgi:ring-1,2-phenylacetyl-CoA epoxidase subunit PaaE
MSQFHSLTIASIKQETRDAIVITFAVPSELKEKFRFTQGQYLTLRAEINAEELRRSYSICSAVQDNVLRVAIKKIQGGAFSNWASATLKPGMQIDVMPPMGHFNVPLSATNSKHYLGFFVRNTCLQK